MLRSNLLQLLYSVDILSLVSHLSLHSLCYLFLCDFSDNGQTCVRTIIMGSSVYALELTETFPLHFVYQLLHQGLASHLL